MSAVLITAIEVTRRRSFLTQTQKVYEATLAFIRQQRTQYFKDVQVVGILRLQHIVNSDWFDGIVTEP